MSEIYDNLDIGIDYEKLQSDNRNLTLHIKALDRDIERLCIEMKAMKEKQNKLTTNISELFNTAKLELKRKDNIIADLRRQIDDILFRRGESRPPHSNLVPQEAQAEKIKSESRSDKGSFQQDWPTRDEAERDNRRDHRWPQHSHSRDQPERDTWKPSQQKRRRDRPERDSRRRSKSPHCKRMRSRSRERNRMSPKRQRNLSFRFSRSPHNNMLKRPSSKSEIKLVHLFGGDDDDEVVCVKDDRVNSEKTNLVNIDKVNLLEHSIKNRNIVLHDTSKIENGNTIFHNTLKIENSNLTCNNIIESENKQIIENNIRTVGSSVFQASVNNSLNSSIDLPSDESFSAASLNESEGAQSSVVRNRRRRCAKVVAV